MTMSVAATGLSERLPPRTLRSSAYECGYIFPMKLTILPAKQEREALVFQQGLTRRGALGGAATLAAMRGARAQDLSRASIALLRLSASGPIFIAQAKGWVKEAVLDLALKCF